MARILALLALFTLCDGELALDVLKSEYKGDSYLIYYALEYHCVTSQGTKGNIQLLRNYVFHTLPSRGKIMRETGSTASSFAKWYYYWRRPSNTDAALEKLPQDRWYAAEQVSKQMEAMTRDAVTENGFYVKQDAAYIFLLQRLHQSLTRLKNIKNTYPHIFIRNAKGCIALWEAIVDEDLKKEYEAWATAATALINLLRDLTPTRTLTMLDMSNYKKKALRVKNLKQRSFQNGVVPYGTTVNAGTSGRLTRHPTKLQSSAQQRRKSQQSGRHSGNINQSSSTVVVRPKVHKRRNIVYDEKTPGTPKQRSFQNSVVPHGTTVNAGTSGRLFNGHASKSLKIHPSGTVPTISLRRRRSDDTTGSEPKDSPGKPIKIPQPLLTIRTTVPAEAPQKYDDPQRYEATNNRILTTSVSRGLLRYVTNYKHKTPPAAIGRRPSHHHQLVFQPRPTTTTAPDEVVATGTSAPPKNKKPRTVQQPPPNNNPSFTKPASPPVIDKATGALTKYNPFAKSDDPYLTDYGHMRFGLPKRGWQSADKSFESPSRQQDDLRIKSMPTPLQCQPNAHLPPKFGDLLDCPEATDHTFNGITAHSFFEHALNTAKFSKQFDDTEPKTKKFH